MPNNITYATGGDPVSSQLNEQNDPSILDRLGSLITEIYETSKDKLDEILKCPGGQKRGWKILDGDSIVEFAPCSCYDDALWPMVLGIPAAAKAGATFAGKILVKKAKRKWRKQAIKHFKYKLDELLRSYGDGLKLLFNIGILRRKLPPVKPGFVRLYRGQGVRRLQQKARGNINIDTPNILRDKTDLPQFGTPDGKFWTDDIRYANIFTYPDKLMHEYTPESEIFFIDIPIAEYQKAALGLNRGTGTVSNLQMIPGQKYLTEAGATFDSTVREFVFPPTAKMPLRRRLPDGTIGIVEDVPNSKIDMDLNPAVFAWNEESAQTEFYLDSSLYNTNFLAQVTAEANLAQESSTQAFIRLKEKTKAVMAKRDELERILDGDEITPTDTIQKFVTELEVSSQDLSSEIDRIFDVYEIDLDYAVQYLRQMATITFSIVEYMKYFLPWFIGLLVFIERIMSLVSIVKDKSCIPLMEGGLSEFSNKPRMAQIRNQRIQNKASVWAELNPETCECSECPEDWSYCDHSSITNLYLKETNSCIPPCCGGQEFKPITLVEVCKCDCPEGKVFMSCECSECTQSDSLLTSIFNPSKPGICVDANPDPDRLVWNAKSCSWECKDHVIEHPPYLMGGFVIRKLPPCPDNKNRKPNSCECSGGYSIEPCSEEKLKKLFNIVPIYQINIIND